MFLFINATNTVILWESSFKYIPCFYLSAVFFFNGFLIFHSNTSHVFIYQVQTANFRSFGRNSNTSHVFIYQKSFPTVPLFLVSFKYIPCFYLSTTTKDMVLCGIYSNTSHVFIYLKFGDCLINTQH